MVMNRPFSDTAFNGNNVGLNINKGNEYPEEWSKLLLTPNTFKDFAHRKTAGEWHSNEDFARAVAKAQLAKALTYLKAEIEKIENPYMATLKRLEFDSGEVSGVNRAMIENDIATYDQAIQDMKAKLEEK